MVGTALDPLKQFLGSQPEKSVALDAIRSIVTDFDQANNHGPGAHFGRVAHDDESVLASLSSPVWHRPQPKR
jgi:hypothetical protein